MTLWAVLGVMTAAAVAAVLVPLLRRRPEARPRMAYDLAVYRDQLEEVEGDLARGLITPGQAEAARVEIKRRMLAAAREDEGRPAAPSGRSARPPWLAAGFVGVVLSAGAVGIYLVLGSPEVPSRPFAGRAATEVTLTAEEQALEEAVAELSRRLEEQPQDVAGWRLLGRSYLVLGRYHEAVDALRHAQLLAGGDPEVASELGEALVLVAQGIVTPEARELFRAALEKQPKDPAARYYLGLAHAQRGELAEALAVWQALAADAPRDAPWLEQLHAQMRPVAEELGIELAEMPPAPRAPQEEASEAEGGAPAETRGAERPETIESMVAGLAERLESDPNDLEGWLMLARSYRVLERLEAAAAAYRRALALAPENAGIASQLGETLVMAEGGRVTPEAQAVFEEALRLAPADPTARFFRGLGYAQDGERTKALKLWRALAQDSPADLPWMEQLSILIRVVESWAETAAGAPQGSGASPLVESLSDVEGWRRVAHAYDLLGEPAKAREAYGRAAELRPDDVAVLAEYAGALVAGAGEGSLPPRAVELYRRILSLDPTNAEALWFVAMAESEAGEGEAALERLSTLLEVLRPGTPGYAIVKARIEDLESSP